MGITFARIFQASLLRRKMPLAQTSHLAPGGGGWGSFYPRWVGGGEQLPHLPYMGGISNKPSCPPGVVPTGQFHLREYPASAGGGVAFVQDPPCTCANPPPKLCVLYLVVRPSKLVYN